MKRTCKICGRKLSLDKFNYVHNGYKDSYCKQCRKAFHKGYYLGRKYAKKSA